MSLETAVIHLVDDDRSFLTAMSRLLRGMGFAVQTFNSATEFLAQFAVDTRGCVIVDLNMPGVSGLELQESLVKAGNSIPIVFLTGAGDLPSSVRAMRRGAEDFLSKRAPKDELLDAVRRALERDARDHAERARLRNLQAPFATLTPREREVLTHVLQGKLNKQTARDLGVDERSVKRHRTSIMAKLRVESVAELTHLVHAAGLHGGIKGEASPAATAHRP